MRETEPAAARLPLLFLVADTARAMTKLRARDRAQLVVFAYQAGLVGPAGRIDPAAARGGVSRLWGARDLPAWTTYSKGPIQRLCPVCADRR